MKKERFEVITYQEFACKDFGRKNFPFNTAEYRDDENKFVNLSHDDDLMNACRCFTASEQLRGLV